MELTPKESARTLQFPDFGETDSDACYLDRKAWKELSKIMAKMVRIGELTRTHHKVLIGLFRNRSADGYIQANAEIEKKDIPWEANTALDIVQAKVNKSPSWIRFHYRGSVFSILDFSGQLLEEHNQAYTYHRKVREIRREDSN